MASDSFLKPSKCRKISLPEDDVDLSEEGSTSNGVDDDSVKGNFKKFRISKPSRKILKSRGIAHLFPIQYLTFDGVYDGRDVIGQARKLYN